MKVFKWIIGIVIVLVVLATFAKFVLLKDMLVSGIEKATGFGVELESVNVNLFSSQAEIKGFRLLNPDDYPEADAIEIKRFYVKYNLIAFFKGDVHLYDVDLDIPKLVAVQKADGEMNVQRLVKNIREDDGEVEKEKTDEKPKPQPPEEKKEDKKEGKESGFLIDNLQLTIGEIKYLEYEDGNPEPTSEVLKIDETRTYKNITDPAQVLQKILGEFVLRKGLRQIDANADEISEKLGVKPEEVKQAAGIINGLLNSLQNKKGPSD